MTFRPSFPALFYQTAWLGLMVLDSLTARGQTGKKGAAGKESPMLGPWGKIVLCGLIAATAAAFFVPIARRVRIVLAGAPEDRFGDLWRRFGHAMVKVLLQPAL